MATEVKFRRGTTAEHASFTGADGEVTFDTDKQTWVMHDGLTAGGFPMPSPADLQNNPFTYVTAGGTADALTLTLDPAIAAYGEGQMYPFKAASNNTGPATINVNEKGNLTLKKNAGADDLDADDLVAGGIYVGWNDGTNVQLTGGASGGGGGITLGTEQSTTSGTSKTFSGLAGTKKIDIMFNGVSLTADVDLKVTIGPASGLEITGYFSRSGELLTASQTVNVLTTAFNVNSFLAGSLWGTMTLTLEDNSDNTWTCNHVFHSDGTAGIYFGAGAKSLLGELTQLQIFGGTFDGGAVNIQYQ